MKSLTAVSNEFWFHLKKNLLLYRPITIAPPFQKNKMKKIQSAAKIKWIISCIYLVVDYGSKLTVNFLKIQIIFNIFYNSLIIRMDFCRFAHCPNP